MSWESTTYQDGTTIYVLEDADGTWTVRATSPDGSVHTTKGWPNIETARLVAYQMRNPTPLRSHRKGGGYVRA